MWAYCPYILLKHHKCHFDIGPELFFYFITPCTLGSLQALNVIPECNFFINEETQLSTEQNAKKMHHRQTGAVSIKTHQKQNPKSQTSAHMEEHGISEHHGLQSCYMY